MGRSPEQAFSPVVATFGQLCVSWANVISKSGRQYMRQGLLLRSRTDVVGAAVLRGQGRGHTHFVAKFFAGCFTCTPVLCGAFES
mmetsp:Transcript_53808/g.143178  ORF Transcript_53808/g.143178 Transcript_53808/m.143178 type:complete len:85 (-) Transcript_53808:7-261(-)